MDKPIFKIQPPQRFSLNLKELWQYKELLYFFAWRDIKVKYKQAALGIAWAMLQPLLLALLFTVIFSKGMKMKSDALPYPVFALIGTALWQIFTSFVQSSASGMVGHANIIKKIYFPRLAIPFASLLTALFDFIFAFISALIVAAFFGVFPSFPLSLIYIPTSVLLMALPACGLGLWFSALNVKYRDFQYVLPFFLQLLFFASPIIYPDNFFADNWISTLLSWNPVSGASHLMRAAFADDAINFILIGKSFCSGILLMAIGIYVFRKMEAFFADIA